MDNHRSFKHIGQAIEREVRLLRLLCNTLDSLVHPTFPHFVIGLLEVLRSGTLNIIDWLKANNNPTPSWEEQAGSIYVTFRPAALPEDHREPGKNILQDVMKLGTKSAPSRRQVQIMNKCREDRTLLELMEIAGRSDRTKFRRQVLNPLIEAGFIEMTIPDKPQSSKQEYRLSDKGVKFLSGGQKTRR